MPRRVDPFKNFKFRVLLGGTVVAGFQEVAAVTKLPGLNKSTDVTFKRGVVDAAALRDWLNGTRKRTITIELHGGAPAVEARWTLRGATIVKQNAEPMNAKGTDVAIEELVLSAERLEFMGRAT